MKKSIIAVIAAAAVAALCVPALSGCSANVGYILKTDENGEKYYSVAAEGFTAFMKGEVVIPEYHDGIPVKEIEPSGFAGTAISKVVIPATVEVIGNAAFSYITSLTEVEFAEGSALETIPWGGFAYCYNLGEIVIPSSVKEVDGLAFYGCSRLSGVELPSSLETIGVGAFGECASLEGIELPQGLVTIASLAFSYCAALKSIVLPDGMHDREEPVLDEDGNPKKDEKDRPVTKTIPAVGALAFCNCTSLELAVLGEGITTIESGTFSYCSALSELYLPSTLKTVKGVDTEHSSIYPHAFYEAGLESVYYAGTEEEWALVEIDNNPYSSGSEYLDNSALTKATVNYGTSYTKKFKNHS